MPRGNQLIRQWRFLQMIDRPAGVAVDDAARELGCTIRTIWRDLRVLEAAHFPIYTDRLADDRRSIWRISDAFKRKLPLKLTLSELAALLMSRDLLGAGGILGPAVGSLVEKIEAILSRDALAQIDQMRDSIGVRAVGAKLQAPSAEHLAVIQAALAERRQLRLQYYSMSRDELSTRQVDPYHLTLYAGGFYLVGHCHTRRALRIFAVERVRECTMLSVRFQMPSAFDIEQYLAGAWGIIRGDIVTVKVVFARSLARYIRDRLWHPTQRLQTLEDGRLEMTLRAADTLEVRRWILGFGSEAEVREPATLRDALRREAEALVHTLAPRRIVGAPAPATPRPGQRHREARRPRTS
jgi:predicted DNA-binding transcriptional regulator YafY